VAYKAPFRTALFHTDAVWTSIDWLCAVLKQATDQTRIDREYAALKRSSLRYGTTRHIVRSMGV
jgi:hypothetical protein